MSSNTGRPDDDEATPESRVTTPPSLEEGTAEDRRVRTIDDQSFYAILDVSPVPMALNDGQQRITYLNSAFVQTFGYTPADLPTIAEWWSRAYPEPAYRQWVTDAWRAELDRARRTGTAFAPMEVTVRCKRGTSKTVLASVAAFSSPLEHSHLIVLYDITTRKRAEEAVRQSQDWHRTILRTAMDGFWLVDKQGRLQEVNDTYCQMSGYAEAELVGKHLSELEAVESADDIAAHIATISARHEGRFESRHRRKDGTLFDVEVSAQYRAAEGGRLVCFLRDITERVRAEEAVRSNAQQLKSYLDNAGDAIYVIELRTGRIRNCNARACQDLGYTEEELLELSATDVEALLPPETVAAIHDQLRPGVALTIEGAHKRKDGSVFPVEIRLSTLAPAQPDLMVAMARDISDRKQAEAGHFGPANPAPRRCSTRCRT